MNEINENLLFNKIPLEKIKVGMSASYSQTITDADIKTFAGVSGDRNPIHMDEEYAKKSRFKKRIAHGMMTASYFSALFGTKIPGEGCVYTYQSLKFKRPVYVGDTVEAIVTVTDVDLIKRRVKFSTICKVKDKIVTIGEAEIYVPIEFKKVLINNKDELLNYKEQIFELFEKSFGKMIDDKLWEWAYIDNPNGNPIVSLYFDNDKLIGHYAVIPMTFRYKEKSIKGLLSMTTMVEKSYRKYGVFVEQASEVYELAKELGYKFVCGFPNKKSAPGFKKRLNWTLQEDFFVAQLTYDELLKLKKRGWENSIFFDIYEKENFDWRLNKPGQKYFMKGKNILKKYDSLFDIVFHCYDFSMLDKDKKYNLLTNEQNYIEKKQFDYVFGYKIFDSSLKDAEFKVDLLISDVF